MFNVDRSVNIGVLETGSGNGELTTSSDFRQLSAMPRSWESRAVRVVSVLLASCFSLAMFVGNTVGCVAVCVWKCRCWLKVGCCWWIGKEEVEGK